MTLHISEDVAGLWVDWRFIALMGNAVPPRDPNDDDDEDDEEDDEEQRGDPEPPVVREPDE